LQQQPSVFIIQVPFTFIALRTGLHHVSAGILQVYMYPYAFHHLPDSWDMRNTNAKAMGLCQHSLEP